MKEGEVNLYFEYGDGTVATVEIGAGMAIHVRDEGNGDVFACATTGLVNVRTDAPFREAAESEPSHDRDVERFGRAGVDYGDAGSFREEEPPQDVLLADGEPLGYAPPDEEYAVAAEDERDLLADGFPAP